MLARFKGAIAQLGERYNGIVEVSGSIPLSSTKLSKEPADGGFFCVWLFWPAIRKLGFVGW